MAFINVVRSLHPRPQPAFTGHSSIPLGASDRRMSLTRLPSDRMPSLAKAATSARAAGFTPEPIIGNYCDLGEDVRCIHMSYFTMAAFRQSRHRSCQRGHRRRRCSATARSRDGTSKFHRSATSRSATTSKSALARRSTERPSVRPASAPGTKIDTLVVIGHNCQIGRHTLFVSQVGIAGSVTTGDYVVMAGPVGIADHLHIGDRSLLGAKAGVHKDVPPDQRMLGAPATPDKEQMRIMMSLEKLPESSPRT